MSNRGLRLDRMAIEEAGPAPDRIAAAIHAQLDLPRGPTPVLNVAAALDIVEIRHEPLTSFEAALVCEPERGEGVIVVNAKSSQRRRLFSVAHELGHFLNLWHQPIEAAEQFACRKEDLVGAWRRRSSQASRHAIQEAEANRFAIELLAPEKFVRPFMSGLPDLAKALRLASALKLSREAAVRRYAECHETPTALVFSREGVVRYIERWDDFPFVVYRRGERLPGLPPPTGDDNLSDHVEVDPREWLLRLAQGGLVAQTLHQRDGFAVTLLMIDHDAEGD